jgi:hypothetical protein
MVALGIGILDVIVHEAEVVPELERRGAGQRLAVVAGQRLVGQHAEEGADALPARGSAPVDAEVVRQHLVQRPRVSLSLVEDARHLGLDISHDLAKLGPDVHRRRVPDLLEKPCHGAGTRSGFGRMWIMIRRCSMFRIPDR